MATQNEKESFWGEYGTYYQDGMPTLWAILLALLYTIVVGFVKESLMFASAGIVLVALFYLPAPRRYLDLRTGIQAWLYIEVVTLLIVGLTTGMLMWTLLMFFALTSGLALRAIGVGDDIWEWLTALFEAPMVGMRGSSFLILTGAYATVLIAVPYLTTETWILAMASAILTMTVVLLHCVPKRHNVTWGWGLICFLILAVISFGIELAIANRLAEALFWALAMVISLFGSLYIEFGDAESQSNSRAGRTDCAPAS